MNIVYSTTDKTLSIDEPPTSTVDYAKPSIEESVSQSVDDILNSSETSAELPVSINDGKDIVDYTWLFMLGGFMFVLAGIVASISSKNMKTSKFKKSVNLFGFILIIIGFILVAWGFWIVFRN